jgi:tetratricopeptide (TPR) repeat protein
VEGGGGIAIQVGGQRAPRALPPEPRAGIPPDPIDHFTDRESALAELYQQLQQSRRVVLHGLGGVGKTQLALRYLNLHRSEYIDGCFWLRADRATTLIADLASLAWRIRPPLPEREEPEQGRQVEAVLRWLHEHQRWLVVLDNLDQPAQEAVLHWLPPGLPGHVVVTSRSPEGSHRLGLEPLPVEVATSFLLERTGQADAAAARAIAEAVGGLPLALEQAAAYLIENDWHSLADYARLLQTRMAELLREGKPEDYPLPVASTWQLSFRRVEQEMPPAADLLRLCAFLAPDDIPLPALQSGAEALPAGLREAITDEIGSDRVLAALRRYSLLQRHGDALQVHRLVQWVIRESMAVDQRESWVVIVIRLLARTFPHWVNNPKQWPVYARLLPHAQAALGLTRDDGPDPVSTSWLLDRVGTYLQTRGDYGRARRFLQRALQIQETALGPDHPDTASTLTNLAHVLYAQGELAAARPLMERVVAIRERVLGPDHPDTALALNNLGLLLKDQGDLLAARPLLERALAIREKVLGPDHADTAQSLNNLGLLLYDLRDPRAARRAFERAVAIWQRTLGPDHPETAWGLYNLGSLLYELGEVETARPLLEGALRIRERVLGPDHPDTARSLNRLALLLEDGGELTTARAMLERALAIDETALGPENAMTAVDAHNLGRLLHGQGDLKGARTLLERALSIWERVLGPNHRDTASGLTHLGLVLRDLGEVDAARTCFARGLTIRERVLGSDDPLTAATRGLLESLPRSAPG